jgi:hypothetical protein
MLGEDHSRYRIIYDRITEYAGYNRTVNEYKDSTAY